MGCSVPAKSEGEILMTLDGEDEKTKGERKVADVLRGGRNGCRLEH